MYIIIFIYIKSNYKQKSILKLVLFQDFFYKMIGYLETIWLMTIHNLPLQDLVSMQHAVTKNTLACFLDTQLIPDLVAYETECTCWWCCQPLCLVRKAWINTTDCNTLPPGVWGDAGYFCREVAAKEGSRLGLEADETCEESRVTVSKLCARIYPLCVSCNM